MILMPTRIIRGSFFAACLLALVACGSDSPPPEILPAPQMGLITGIFNGDAGGESGFETFLPQGNLPQAWDLQSEGPGAKICSNPFPLEGGAEYVLRFDIACDTQLGSRLEATLSDHPSLENSHGTDGSGGGSQLIENPVIGQNEITFVADPDMVAVVEGAGHSYRFGFIAGDPAEFTVSNIFLEATGNYPLFHKVSNGDAGGNSGFETYIPEGFPARSWKLESDSSWSKISSNSFQMEGAAEYVLRFDIECETYLSTQLHVTIVDHPSLGNNYGIDGSGGGSQLIYSPVIGHNEVTFVADPDKVAAVQAAEHSYWFGFVVGDPGGQPEFQLSNLRLEATGNYPLFYRMNNGRLTSWQFENYNTAGTPTHTWYLQNTVGWAKTQSNLFDLVGGAEYRLRFTVTTNAPNFGSCSAIIGDHESLGNNYESIGGGWQVLHSVKVGENEITFVADPGKVAFVEANGFRYIFGFNADSNCLDAFTVSNLSLEATGNYPLINTILNGFGVASDFETFIPHGLPVTSWTLENSYGWGKISSNTFSLVGGAEYVLRFDIDCPNSFGGISAVISDHASLGGNYTPDGGGLQLQHPVSVGFNEIIFVADPDKVEFVEANGFVYKFGFVIGGLSPQFKLSNLSLERVE
jgi:hypothetical protein